MRKNLLRFICYSTMLLAITSCSNEIQEEFAGTIVETKAEVEVKKVELVDGILKFNDMVAFSDAILNPEKISEVKVNSEKISFKSLSNKYVELEKSYDLMLVDKEANDKELSEGFIQNRVNSSTLAELLNEDGVVIVGNLAIKIIGDYAYSTTIDNLNKISSLEKEEDLKSLENVSVNRVIEPLIFDNSTVLTKGGSSGGAYDRSFVFTTSSKYRREHVTFNAQLIRLVFTTPNGTSDNGAYLEVVMEGRAQSGTKAWPLNSIIWGATFSDEMVWAEMYMNYGSFYYTQPPVSGGLNIPQGTNSLPTGLMVRVQNKTKCVASRFLGLSGGVSSVKANITFKFLKSIHQPSDIQSVYTNNYTSIY